jgi:hypothetical protein
MTFPESSPIQQPDTFTPARRRRLGARPSPLPIPAEGRTTREPFPLHSLGTVVAGMFVVSMAAGWIALASTTTAPLVMAGALLGRAAGAIEEG